MSSSFAASTCRTILAPFRQDISRTPRLYVMTRRIKYSKIVGAVGFEPTNPSLVRRKKPRIAPIPQSRLIHLYCENHAARCPKVPVKVWTVVPVSGSRRSSKITIARHRGKAPPPRLRACSISSGQTGGYPGRMAGTPATAIGSWHGPHPHGMVHRLASRRLLQCLLRQVIDQQQRQTVGLAAGREQVLDLRVPGSQRAFAAFEVLPEEEFDDLPVDQLGPRWRQAAAEHHEQQVRNATAAGTEGRLHVGHGRVRPPSRS